MVGNSSGSRAPIGPKVVPISRKPKIRNAWVNAPVKANLAPLIIGFIVVAIGISIGANAGYAINPARDFGPRIFAWIEGWGKIAMPGDYGNVNNYFWIPIVGPCIGALIGAGIYDFLIRNTLIARGAQPDLDVVEAGADALDERGEPRG